MGSPLDQLLEEGVITEVVGRLQSGKEAEVFIVRYAERVVAAKVYKDRQQRSFKNNAAYKEGRAVRNTRDQRAMDRRSRFGQATEEETWKSAEADAMYRLHAAEVRVPEPVLFFEGVLLMELVLDAEGVTARRLIDSTLSPEQANAAYHDMLTQLVRMLACDLIHGDLSPYNTLWAARGVTIIDFPQIVSAAQNSNSERFFLRDAENILGYFRSIDPRLEARRGDAAEIWRAYMRRELTPDFVPTGRLRPPPPQRPLPIAAPRSSAQAPQRFGGAPQRPRIDGPPPPRGDGQQAYGNGQQPRGNGQQPRPNGQQPRPNGQQPRGNGQQPRPNGQQSRSNGQPRGNGQQPRGNGQQPRPNGQQPRPNGQQPRPNGQQPRPNGQQSRGNGWPSQGQRAQDGRGGRAQPPGERAHRVQQTRRAMPEVIVRPRAAVTASAPPREPRLEPSEGARRSEPDLQATKRRS
jgi:RIO kinase 1